MAERQDIQFNTSMSIDKRNQNFAYLRKSVFNSGTQGLYPSKDFYKIADIDNDFPLIGFARVDSYHSSVTPKAIAIYADYSTIYYKLNIHNATTGALIHSVDIPYPITAYVVVGEYLYVSLSGDIYRINLTSGAISSLIGITATTSRYAIFDGLYIWWISNDKIHKQLPGTTAPIEAFVDAGLSRSNTGVAWNDYLVLPTYNLNGELLFYFWNKSDPDLYEKRIVMPKASLLAIEVVNSFLTIVIKEMSSENPKEGVGTIRVMRFDGSRFVELNSILLGAKDGFYPTETRKNSDATVDYFLFTIKDNDSTDSHADLAKNYIYKVFYDGRIEVLANPEDYGVTGIVNSVIIGDDFISFGEVLATTTNKLFTNINTNTSFKDYEGYSNTEYITNFYCNPDNNHTLNSFSFTFEKLFRNEDNEYVGDEEVSIYYRTSDRLPWTLLKTVRAEDVINDVDQRRENKDIEIPVYHQRYQITKNSDSVGIVEFNEIQFKFNTKNGMSILGAYFLYDYITRNTVR